MSLKSHSRSAAHKQAHIPLTPLPPSQSPQKLSHTTPGTATLRHVGLELHSDSSANKNQQKQQQYLSSIENLSTIPAFTVQFQCPWLYQGAMMREMRNCPIYATTTPPGLT